MEKLIGQKDRPPFEGIYIYIFAVLVGYWGADLTITSYRSDMLPSDAPPVRAKKAQTAKRTYKSDYDVIAQRNIFNSDGKIPPALSAGDEEEKIPQDAPAVLSRLPVKLLGTLVHANPGRSIATINVSGKSTTGAYKVDSDLEGLATVTKIERRRVTFRNKNNGRLEYIEIPEDTKISFGMKAPIKKTDKEGAVAKTGEFEFSVKRSDVTKYTSNLSSILNQARMVPNRPPGGGGTVEGFRFTSIQPGSIFEKLGFQANDVIKGVNGEEVNSPTKAMEMFNLLKNSSDLRLTVERNGSEEEFRYNIE
ncbi:MAG: general secretion pathway protein GspC [Bdellovibrionales bacterium]|nr:general secretion pathway protein GspC [Bdellovibrionales bacterium]